MLVDGHWVKGGKYYLPIGRQREAGVLEEKEEKKWKG